MQTILYDKEARATIKRGIDKAADAIKVTLGPVGKTMVIDLGQTYPKVTNDGVTGAKIIKLDDPLENVGAKYIREIAMKANENGGDGTTTATVLAQAMIDEAFKVIDEDPSKIPQVMRGLQEALQEAKKLLDEMARPVKGRDDIRNVALISSLDPEVADAIADAIEQLGEKATIVVEEGSTPGISIETAKGMRLPKGVQNEYFITDLERNETRLENPRVIVTDKRISSGEQIGKLLERLMAEKILTFVLVADDIAGEALATLLVNKQRGLFNCIAVTAPYAGERRHQAYADLAALTGGQVISDGLGHRFEDFDLSFIGSCKKVIANRATTTFIEGAGNATERVKSLQKELDEAKNASEADTLRERISGLAGGIGVIRVGAYSETELSKRRDKVDDALNATRAAIEGGIVVGGGLALMNVAVQTQNEIFRKALHAPFDQMATNSGQGECTVELDWVNTFDWISGKEVNAFEAGIIDPVKITKSSLESAVSVVTAVISVGSLIVESPDKEEKK